MHFVVLYLVSKGLLDIPVLYLSNQIVRIRPDYDRLLQHVQEQQDSDVAWQAWVQDMLSAVEITAADAVRTVMDFKAALLDR